MDLLANEVTSLVLLQISWSELCCECLLDAVSFKYNLTVLNLFAILN